MTGRAQRDGRWARRGRVLALGSVALSVAACGATQAKSASEIETKNVILTAYSHSIGIGSARVSFAETVNANLNGTPEKVTVTGHGVTDLRRPKGSLTVSAPLLGAAVELRLLGNYLYLKLPASLRSSAEQNRPWVSLDLGTIAKQRFGATLARLSTSWETPTQALSYLRSVSKTGLVRAGSATVGGIPTTEYRAVISFGRAASVLSGPARTALRNAERYAGTKTLPVKVWVDRNNLVRRISYHLAVGNSSSPVASVDAVVTLSGYGTPVVVAAPPASATFDLTAQALSALASGLAGGPAGPQGAIPARGTTSSS